MEASSSSSRNTSDCFGSLRPINLKDLLCPHLSDPKSYIKDCEKDLELKSFLPRGIENISQSFDAYHQFLDLILDSSKRVERFILENKEAILRNKDFGSLVDLYFESSAKALDFRNALESCSKKAKMNGLIFGYAIKQFKKYKDGVTQTEYVKTLEELKRLRASSDPLDDDILNLMASMHDHQANLSNELHNLQKKLNKEMENVNVSEVWTVGSSGKTCNNNSWKMYENPKKMQIFTMLVLSLKYLVRNEVQEKISELVDRLESRMNFGTNTTALFIEDEQDLSEMDKMMEDLDAFTQGIQILAQHADNFYQDIMMGRTNIRNLMLNLPSD